MAEMEGWVIKCGGRIKTWKKRWLVLKGNMLRYYAKQGDKIEKGYIELRPGVTVTEVKIKKSPYAFCVKTEGRDYVIYPESRSKDDSSTWQEKILAAVNGKKSDSDNKEASPRSPKSPKKKPSNDSERDSGEQKSPRNDDKNGTTKPAENAAPVAVQNGSIISRLNFSKDIVNFLKGGVDNQMCEFWNLWFNTVNNQLNEDAECDIQFNFSYSADFNKLFWNSAGPQYLMIQQLVDFFYIVGAPEEEIEKLNQVGEKINPDRIGSWINVSEMGGIDGGWCFTFPVDIKVALPAIEQGTSVDNLLSWCEKHNVTECYYLARDMGAEPPRQTEVKIHIPPTNNLLETVIDAYDMCGFPHPPEGALNVLREAKALNLSINITEDDFVRISVSVPNPSLEIVKKFAPTDVEKIQSGLGQVSAIEFQYLKEDYGYNVYHEGHDVHVSFTVN